MDSSTLPRVNAQLDNFAIRSFRDIADGDYISARMAFRARLLTQCLWASQQTIEKYLKCILLLNRIPANDIKHDLTEAQTRIADSRGVNLGLCTRSVTFIEHIDLCGRFRYQEISHYAFSDHLIDLNRLVWELRRFCIAADVPPRGSLQHGKAVEIIRIPGGRLEKIIEGPTNETRKALLWQNAFFGRKSRKKIRMERWMSATNAPLYLHPEILDEVLRYVYLPRDVINGYREHAKEVAATL
jgi:hypothetical protein